ncbi:hypothetical protein Bca4012_067994 [Brassica carinata]|uniref:DYW domain-containing protein n=1 Tax=Brassica carinata TaxID=52824 RepID=A0A8X7VUG7_BRACI|nr:hypothetical protein Bca52824_020220 [Brassica carinata]
MWNTLIRACAHDRGKSAPDKHTFSFVLKYSCAHVFGLSQGKQIHCQVVKHGLGGGVYVNNGLIHLYGSFFIYMPERSLVSWNLMIDALVRVGEYASVLELFREMQKSSEPDGYTMQSVLNAHPFLVRRCDLDVAMDFLVKNSLIEMYCKCGSLGMSAQMFQGIQKRGLASWNTVILGFATHGRADEALDCSYRMVRKLSFSAKTEKLCFPAITENLKQRVYSLRLHSEKLTIAFGLISLPPQIPISVFKNLRVCSHCHEVTKQISKVFNTESIVRDRDRFNHFKDGSSGGASRFKFIICIFHKGQ